VLLPTYVSAQIVKFPLNETTTATLAGSAVNGNHAVHQTGIVGYVFPIGTQKHTYQVFDTTLNRAVPFAYEGTAQTGGIPTYIFEENVRPDRRDRPARPRPAARRKTAQRSSSRAASSR